MKYSIPWVGPKKLVLGFKRVTLLLCHGKVVIVRLPAPLPQVFVASIATLLLTTYWLVSIVANGSLVVNHDKLLKVLKTFPLLDIATH